VFLLDSLFSLRTLNSNQYYFSHIKNACKVAACICVFERCICIFKRWKESMAYIRNYVHTYSINKEKFLPSLFLESTKYTTSNKIYSHPHLIQLQDWCCSLRCPCLYHFLFIFIHHLVLYTCMTTSVSY